MVEPKFLHAIDKKSGRVFIIKTRNPAYICEVTVYEKETSGFEYEVQENQGKYYLCRFLRFLESVDVLTDTKTFSKRALTWYLQAIIKKGENNEG